MGLSAPGSNPAHRLSFDHVEPNRIAGKCAGGPTIRRPPLYAKMALGLLSVSLVLAVFSAWVWLRPDGELQYRRGYSPLTAEWKMDHDWIADPYIGKTLRCDLNMTAKNELGRSYTYRAEPIGAGGACFRDHPVHGPVFAVAVGDSFVFGHQVALEAAWTERLEKAVGLDVVNLGISDSGPSQYVRVFEIHGRPFQPRVVILVTFVNDWLDEACFQAWWDLRQKLGSQVDFPRSKAVYEAVRKNAYRLPPDWHNPMLGGSEGRTINGERYLFDASAYAAQDPRSPTIAEGKASEEKRIVELRDRVAGSGARLIVVAIPAKEFVYHEDVKAILPYAREMAPDIFCREIAAWCGTNGILCLDMLPVFRRHVALGEHPYFPIDGHLREEGNQILADELYRVLSENQLLPSQE